MSNIALYRKYRPQNFANFIGQDVIRQTLMNAVESDSIAHSYLFTGPRGTGKTSAARLIAKALNCTNLKDGYEPCDACDFCTSIRDGSLIDVIEIDAASNRGIDEIRDLREKIKFSPTSAKTKVYIIDEVHMLTKEAFNALLKTLEEPPEHAYFVLATTELHKIPETIISRCQRFDFKRLDKKMLLTRLIFIAEKEGVEFEEDALKLIAKASDGGMRDAISTFEQMIADKKITLENVEKNLGITDNQAVIDLLQFIQDEDVTAALDILHDIYSAGHDLTQFNKDILGGLRAKLLEAVKHNAPHSDIIRNVEFFQESLRLLKTSPIPQLPLEVAIVRSAKFSEATAFVKDVEEKAVEAPKAQVPTKAEPKVAKVKESTGQEFTEKLDEKLSEYEQDKGELEDKQKLSVDSIKKEMPRILEHIKTPSVKRSFQTGQVAEINGDSIIVHFFTQFHLDKVNSAGGLSEIESAFAELYGQVKIDAVLKTMDAPAAEPNIAETAAEIFGGELIS